MYVPCEVNEKPLVWTKVRCVFLFDEHSFSGDEAKQQVGSNQKRIVLVCYCLVRVVFVN